MPAKSQWDFGDLFDPPSKKEKAAEPTPTPSMAEKPKAAVLVAPPRQILTVGELNGQVKRLLERQVGRVWVRGEITNFRAQSSGHFYFTLKDATSQIGCVLFRGERVANRDALADGKSVLLEGDLTVYEPRGQYQLRVCGVELEGLGALQAAFERLKQQLLAEGMFAPERKRTIPPLPQRIGLVTSPTGAAIRDVLHVLERRGAGFEIVLAPVRVQGDGAAAEIAQAIRDLNQLSSRGVAMDVILVTRGGGSLEDLWAFNEEAVARAIFESAVPVISAVGHEIDFSISDFVADLRAATPSAAAEILSEGWFSSRERVAGLGDQLSVGMSRELEKLLVAYESLSGRLARVHPRRRIEERGQRLDDLGDALNRAARGRIREMTTAARGMTDRMSRVKPMTQIQRRREGLVQIIRELPFLAREHLRRNRERLRSAEDRLRLLSPNETLKRGYSITFDEGTGKVVRSVDSVAKGTILRTKLVDGDVASRVS